MKNQFLRKYLPLVFDDNIDIFKNVDIKWGDIYEILFEACRKGQLKFIKWLVDKEAFEKFIERSRAG